MKSTPKERSIDNQETKSAITKSQRNLNALKAAEAARRARVKQQMQALEEAAAIEAALVRKAARQRLKRVELEVCQRLGRIALAALRKQGIEGTLLDATDVHRLGPELVSQIHQLLRQPFQDSSGFVGGQRETGSTGAVDLDLSSN